MQTDATIGKSRRFLGPLAGVAIIGLLAGLVLLSITLHDGARRESAASQDRGGPISASAKDDRTTEPRRGPISAGANDRDYYVDALPGELASDHEREVGNLVFRFEFGHGVPSEWTALSEVTDAGSGVGIETKTSHYQLVSEPLNLESGTYSIAAEIQILRGGVSISALDIAQQAFIRTDSYSKLQTRGERFVAWVPFEVSDERREQALILSGWGPRGVNSEWIVRTIELFGIRGASSKAARGS